MERSTVSLIRNGLYDTHLVLVAVARLTALSSASSS